MSVLVFKALMAQSKMRWSSGTAQLLLYRAMSAVNHERLSSFFGAFETGLFDLPSQRDLKCHGEFGALAGDENSGKHFGVGHASTAVPAWYVRDLPATIRFLLNRGAMIKPDASYGR
ncbi:hypothetical protein AC579_4226 [Pseudocercospora musae]|uniref:Uncharacterized protein n=1 Tax=Pseudocercospora musae TaxID=113226 RepID=A0A139IDD1_9PEZI|nr:hypothetical protein AC579_4226 [Pseudocercospora musae]